MTIELLIGRIKVELLEPAPCYSDLPSGQANTYRLLLEAAQREEREIKAQTLLEQLGLKSLLPLAARIEHLQERGFVRLKKYLMAAI